MPETGVYVIREEDHGILYFNKRVQEVSPDVRLGMACHDVWSCSPKLSPPLARQYGRLLPLIQKFRAIIPQNIVGINPFMGYIGKFLMCRTNFF